MAGRPTTYDVALAETLLEWMTEGKTVKSWCKKNKVGQSTVAQWRKAQPEFAELYMHAREDQGDALADDALESALDMEMPAEHKRIIVDTRKWFASKMRPKVYGDKIQQEHSGSVETTNDPIAAMNNLITLATANPTMGPMIREWAEQLLQRLPKIAE